MQRRSNSRTVVCHGLARRVVWWLVIACVASVRWAVAAKAQADVTVLRGRIVLPTDTLDGEVMFAGDTIKCVAADCHAPGDARVIVSDGTYIYPGFVDAHNHVAYNVLPKFTPPKVYAARSQWQGASAYKAFKKPYDDLKNGRHLFCEMVKYGEIRALISGVTTIEGTAPNNQCFSTLVRNVENQSGLGLAADHIRTYILDIKSFDGSVDWTTTKAFVVHIAEGVPTNDAARSEFQTLKNKGLLRRQTVIIHGTAFGDAEFSEMGRIGASLIWSPQSNLVLYHQTTDIVAAKAHQVNISIGVDWNATGSDTIFDELRVADQVNTTTFSQTITPSEWLPMITVNPAKALAVDDRIGTLAVGFKADITVTTRHDADPSINLLKVHLPDVRMVWVGGQLLYGDAPIVEAVRPGACEPFLIHGAEKRVCVADASSHAPNHGETLASLQSALQRYYAQLAPLAR